MDNDTLILVGILAAVYAVLFFMSFPNLMLIVRIRRTPSTYISAFPFEGQVKVSGKAGFTAAKSAITQTDCTFWQVNIEEHRGGKNASWRPLFKTSSSQPFNVFDESSQIFVQPDQGSLILNADFRQSSGMFHSIDESVMDAVTSLGVETTGVLGFKKTLRVSEYLIQPGDDIFVLGHIKMIDGHRHIASISQGDLVIADRGETELLRWLYGRVALRLVVIPLGSVLLLWFFLRL